MTAVIPTARTIQRAIGVLERLPAIALADLAERIIEHLDAGTPDPDLEPEEDDDDEAEEDSPPGTLRPERDGFVRVWRRPARVTVVPEVAT